MRTGDRVETLKERYPVCTGTIKIVSECGRYARVLKRYGSRRSWVKTYATEDLCVIDDRGKPK